MPGHLEKRSKNSWTIVIDIGRDPATGKRKRIYRAFQGTKRDAEKEMARLIAEIERGTYIEPSSMTVAEYLRWWLEQHSKTKNLAPKTVESYNFLIEKHLIPAIGQLPLVKLQPMHVQNYIIKANENLSARTVSYSLTVLRQALKHAVKKWRLIPHNPADAVESPSYRRVKYRALSADELQRFLDAAQGHQDFPLIYTALYTGMRRGELLGLKWQDVDLDRGTIKIRRSLQRIAGKGYITKEPKTEAGRRDVELPPSVVSLLRQLKKEQAENKLFYGKKYHDGGFVFCLPDGRPLDPSNLSRRFHRLAVKAGFPDLRFHDLRHTHASLLLASGEQLHVVQQRLGHEKASTTADIYGHALPGQQKAAAERFDRLFGRQMGGKRPSSRADTQK